MKNTKLENGEVIRQRWDDVEIHKNEFGHLPDRRCGNHPLECNRQGFICKHGIDHTGDEYCRKCLKESIS